LNAKTGLAAIIALLTITGCAAQGPIDNAVTRVALTPEKDQITIENRAHKPIGEIVPIDVSIANGTAEPIGIHTTQVYGINAKGERIVAVPLGQAIQLAGGVDKLSTGIKGALKGAGAGAAIGGVLGAALGAGVGALYGNPVQGALAGAAIGGGLGAAQGGAYGAVGSLEAKEAAMNAQLQALALANQTLSPQFSANGYVFLPTDQDYKFIELLVTNNETQQTTTLQSVYHDEQGAMPEATR
jgi:hypothetical protein